MTNKELKAGIVTLLACTAVALITMAFAANLFPGWTPVVNGAFSGLAAGAASLYVLPWSKLKFS